MNQEQTPMSDTAIQRDAEKAFDLRQKGDWAAYRLHVDWARRAYGRDKFNAAEIEASRGVLQHKKPQYLR